MGKALTSLIRDKQMLYGTEEVIKKIGNPQANSLGVRIE
jgi:hypothetical protein